jgi:serine/threonine protein kinase
LFFFLPEFRACIASSSFSSLSLSLSLSLRPAPPLSQATFKTEANLYMLLTYEALRSVDLQIEWGRGLRHCGLPLARFYSACALLAIEHMHHKGVVHRDIKVGAILEHF